eukprot:TRINITY_DN186_c0_g2_i14.p6 TRINITY_DN186_c0_g2~~TRINITY_DN186_c0_g2_i14.p6  ORF type:complete len:101 (+),score=29.63 TRINITY_DN186_c0_g2_i14:2874-3176(+)
MRMPTCTLNDIPCVPGLSVSEIVGIKESDCDNVTLATSESCFSVAEDDFICTGLNSTCDMGVLSKPVCRRIPKNPCSVGNVTGVTSNCTKNEEVPHNEFL